MAVLTKVAAGGTPREIGRALGRFGAGSLRRLVMPGAYWARTVAEAGGTRARAMEAATRAALPEIAAEVEGLAEGLGLPFDQVFAWMARGDLRPDVPEGCTTVMLPGFGGERVIGHNEDGGPEELSACGLALVKPEHTVDFAAFFYPGSLPGGSFGMNAEGLVVTVNNVRAARKGDGVPRNLVGRAMMACRTLDQAVRLIEALPRAGGFHFALAQAGDPRLLSVEFTGDMVSVIEVVAPAAHANHLIHPGLSEVRQRVTRSSADRQARAEALLGGPPLSILQDAGGPGLPIFRTDPADPDEENTVVSAVATLGDRVATLAIHDPGAGTPAMVVTAAEGVLRLAGGRS